MPNREQIVTEARKWMGTRWVHQGRSVAGIDCVGLLVKTAEGVQYPVTDMDGYSRRPDGTKFLDHLRSHLSPGNYTEPKPGSIGVFRQKQFPCHCGIFGMKDGVLTIIHSSAPRRMVVEEYFSFDWPKALMEVLEFNGVED